MDELKRKAIGAATAASRHSAVRYLFVGGSTFIMDVGLLVLLRDKFHWNLQLANTVSYWTAIIYNFILNRWWSFSAAEKNSLKRHASTYAILLVFNYVFSTVFISVLSTHMPAGAAKALAVLIQMSWTYYIYKNYIFVHAKNEPDAVEASIDASIN